MSRSTARRLMLLLLLCPAAAGCGLEEDAPAARLARGSAAGAGAEPLSAALTPLHATGWDPSCSAEGCGFLPGAAGIGDAYYPESGNGGYDVAEYHLQVTYDPATDLLQGEARIQAIATQDLSRFNLDLDGLTVDAIEVDRRAATWTHEGIELVVTPARGIREDRRFSTVIRYHGVPGPVTTGPIRQGGFVHKDDGALVAGEPIVAAKWFPVNDHPRDPARISLDITGPADLQVVANGRLLDQRTRDGWTTWRWRPREEMAPYLVTWVMGRYTIDTRREQHLHFVDAIDADLFDPIMVPISGDHLVLSGQANSSYKRITRTLAVPASGGELAFHVLRDTEPGFDYFFVEAHVAGTDEWTTLPDVDGFATQETGSCALPFVHPFTENYLTFDPHRDPADRCTPTGFTGEWWAADGASQGWERWRIDLSRYAGQEVEVSLTFASDEGVQANGVAIDDIALLGDATTSFEDGDTGGWQVPGTPPPSTLNANDWLVAGPDELPPSPGEIVRGNLARQGEVLAFASSVFGEYPFRDAGAIVHDTPGISFALENQTRPTYGARSFRRPGQGVGLLVHELAHQWFGDLVRVDSWQHIWLNEGFATYAEWLWAEHQGTPIDLIFDSFYATPAESSFWQLVIGNPGPDRIFNFAVYGRGAMTLHRLRGTVGDRAFFQILRGWASCSHTGTTEAFIELAEDVSGQELDELFDTWLFTAGKPELPEPASLRDASVDPAARERALELVRAAFHRARAGGRPE